MEPHDFSNPFDFHLDQLGIGKRTGDRGCDGMPGVWQQIADKLYSIPAFAGGYPDYGSIVVLQRVSEPFCLLIPRIEIHFGVANIFITLALCALIWWQTEREEL